MFRNERTRRRRQFSIEGLESRNLLSVPIPSPGEIGGITAEGAIKGTINASYTSQTPINGNPHKLLAKFSGKGNAPHLGSVTLTGLETISITTAGKNTNQSYTGGTGTLSAYAGNFTLTFSGSGHTTCQGTMTGTFHGTAVGTSGLVKGASAPLSFQIRSVGHTGAFKITFRIG